MLSLVGRTLPWNNNCCAGSKNPTSYKGMPSRSMLIAMGSPLRM